jgi:hypothetical protein
VALQFLGSGRTYMHWLFPPTFSTGFVRGIREDFTKHKDFPLWSYKTFTLKARKYAVRLTPTSAEKVRNN